VDAPGRGVLEVVDAGCCAGEGAVTVVTGITVIPETLPVMASFCFLLVVPRAIRVAFAFAAEGRLLFGGPRSGSLSGLESEVRESRRGRRVRVEEVALEGQEHRADLRFHRTHRRHHLRGAGLARRHGGDRVGQALEELDERGRRVRDAPERELRVRGVLLQAQDERLHQRQESRLGCFHG